MRKYSPFATFAAMDEAFYSISDLAGRELTPRIPLLPDSVEGKERALQRLAVHPDGVFVDIWRPALEHEGYERFEQLALADKTAFVDQDKRGRVLRYRDEFYENKKDMGELVAISAQIETMHNALIDMNGPLTYSAVGFLNGVAFPVNARTTLYRPESSGFVMVDAKDLAQ